MKNTVEYIYWMLCILVITSSLYICKQIEQQRVIIKELKQINSYLEERNEQ